MSTKKLDIENLKNFAEVPRTFGSTDLALGLEPFKLYEGIIIIKWDKSDNIKVFNSAAMGIRFIDEYTIGINPYQDTDTFKIIKESIEKGNISNDRKKLSINFTDNMELFSKSALFGTNSGCEIEEISQTDLKIINDFGVLNEANICILCEVLSEIDSIKLDASNDFDGIKYANLNLKFPVRFTLNILHRFVSRKAPQPTNRGDNLALEAITLASKLPVFIKMKNKEDKVFKMLDRIREYQKEIKRFSASKNAIKASIIIDDFINNLF